MSAHVIIMMIVKHVKMYGCANNWKHDSYILKYTPVLYWKQDYNSTSVGYHSNRIASWCGMISSYDGTNMRHGSLYQWCCHNYHQKNNKKKEEWISSFTSPSDSHSTQLKIFWTKVHDSREQKKKTNSVGSYGDIHHKK